jgi:type IV pilus assembly protein PilP
MHVVVFALASLAAAVQTPTAAAETQTPAPAAQTQTPPAPAAQTQTPPAPAAQTQTPPAQPRPAPAPQAPPADSYAYQPDGRRDPFLSPFGGAGESRPTSRRGDGPAGMTLAEISVRGIMQSRGTLVAMIQGPDNKTYIVHQGDKLLDGTIKSVTPQGLIVIQEVNDPLSLVKQREVRKLLRSLEDGKE